MFAKLLVQRQPDLTLLVGRLALLLSSVVVSAMPVSVLAEESKKAVETIGEVSIIGNTELPTVTFNLPWSLPSVEKRSDQSPTNKLPNMLTPIEPVRHKQMVHFLHYYQIEMPHFKAN